jgi:hypothetical protein
LSNLEADYNGTLNTECNTEGNRIDKLIEFLDSLSGLIYYNGHMTICITKNKMHMFQPYLINSSVKTLASIKYCCMAGSFSDANTLVRKFRDDLMLYLYILEVLNNRKKIDEKSIEEIVGDKMDIDKIENLIEIMLNNEVNGRMKNDHDICVDAWFDDKVDILPWSIQKKLAIETYINYLETNGSIKKILYEYELKEIWEKIRTKLNKYVHNKGQNYTQVNIILDQNEHIFQEVILKLEFITTIFLTLLILINPSMIQSTEYIDYMDSDLTPPENSQYTIAAFIQEFIDEYINKMNPELKAFLKHNNKYGMIID